MIGTSRTWTSNINRVRRCLRNRNKCQKDCNNNDNFVIAITNVNFMTVKSMNCEILRIVKSETCSNNESLVRDCKRVPLYI